jgi:hypothetical protein
LKGFVTLALCGLLIGGLAFARPLGPAQGNQRKQAKKSAKNDELLHVRMEAVILSDDDGSNPPGVVDATQLHQWIHQANETYRQSNAGIELVFDKDKDLAHVKDSCLNRLNHNQNARAAALAAQYPGKMVVLFRAYNQKPGFECKDNDGLTGNGYTAYNPYAPLGSKECRDRSSKGCSASFVVMPSVYCNSGVGIDFANSKDPGPSVPTKGKDASGCPIFVQSGTSLIFIQNFNQLAHEVGHYFGLPHTFPGPNDQLTKPGAVQSWYDGPPRSGTTRSIKVFDGDSPNGPLDNGGYTGWTFTVTDTPPDVGAQIFVANGVNMCNTPSGKTISDSSGAKVTFHGDSFTFDGKDEHGKALSLTFKPEKDNVMSYFLCRNPMKFTPAQVTTMCRNLTDDPQRKYLLCDEPSNSSSLRSRLGCGH